MQVPYGRGIEVYNKSPFWLRDIFAFLTKPIPRYVILGSHCLRFLEWLQKTQWHEPEELKIIQEKNLKALIKAAYYNVPYYHKLFKERKLKPNDIKTIEDLQKLPILTKEDLRTHFNEFIAVNAKKFKYGLSRTSGSTGKPLKFLLDQQNREIEYASILRQLSWAGIGLEDEIATFRGNLVREHGKTKALWRFNSLSKELDFNTFDMKKNTLKKCTKRLKDFDPDLIKGYPSVLQILGKFMLDNNITVHPKAIHTSSESLFESQKEIIEDAFNCKIYDWYGQSEYVVSAGQCAEGNYHINAESGIMEFIKDGESVAPGELGEIVGTGLYNYSMPFIRYETEDTGKYLDEKCDCRRGLPLLRSFEGRVTDIITMPDGNLISGTSFEHYWKHRISYYTPNVEYVHIIQESRNRLIIEIVKKEAYSNEEAQVILRELKFLLGSQMEIEFKDLDSIPIGRKWRFTESELDTRLI